MLRSCHGNGHQGLPIGSPELLVIAGQDQPVDAAAIVVPAAQDASPASLAVGNATLLSVADSPRRSPVLGRLEDAAPQHREPGSPIHLPLEQLQSVNLALGLTVAPGLAQPRPDGVQVARESSGKAAEWSDA